MSTFSRRLVGIALMVLTSAPSVAVAAEDVSPESLIRDMSNALKKLNYQGNFVHLQNGNVESMSIVHSNDNGGELEYMLSLNGEAREIYRNRALVTCIWPSSKSVIVSESKSRQIIPDVDETLTNGDSYQLTMGEPDRVAGIDTHVIEIKPRDAYRYGYRFWVDKDTKMLLRSMLIDSKNNTLEQVMFTDITYPEAIPAEQFATPGKKIATYKTQTAPKVTLNEKQDRVAFETLPIGYAEISETYQAKPLSERPMSHVMLSDGMASVSVYVEYIDKTIQNDVPLGVSSMGAMNAFTRSLDSALITVVGEVPPTTVESIAYAVRLAE